MRMTDSERQRWLRNPDFITQAYANRGKVCPFCDGQKKVYTQMSERIACVCVFVEEEVEQSRLYQSVTKISAADAGRTYSQLAPVGTKAQWASVTQAAKLLKELTASPRDHKWLVLWGQPGCGKTHLALSAYNDIRPLAVFANVNVLAQQLRDGLDFKREDKPKDWLDTDAQIDLLAQAPVFFLDDLGAESPKSEFVFTAISDIISRRYQAGQDLPTVVTTNHSPVKLLARYPRLGSRILDVDLSDVIHITLPDHRTRRPAAVT